MSDELSTSNKTILWISLAVSFAMILCVIAGIIGVNLKISQVELYHTRELTEVKTAHKITVEALEKRIENLEKMREEMDEKILIARRAYIAAKTYYSRNRKKIVQDEEVY